MNRLFPMLALLWSVPAFAVGDPDFEAIQQAIDRAVNENKLDSLMGREFLVEAPFGSELEFLQPEAGFRVEPVGASRYKVTIVSPDALYEDLQVAVRAVPLKWRFTLEGAGETSTVTAGIASCTFEVLFTRADGNPVPLDLPHFEYQYSYDTTRLIRERQDSNTIRFTRRVGDVSVERVQLKIRSRDSGDLITQGVAEVPYCSSTIQPTVTPRPAPRWEGQVRAELGFSTGFQAGVRLPEHGRWVVGLRGALSGYLSDEELGGAVVLGPVAQRQLGERGYLRGALLAGPALEGGAALIVPLDAGLDIPWTDEVSWFLGGGVTVGVGPQGPLVAPGLSVGIAL